jgi:predicted nucleotidyltransferase
MKKEKAIELKDYRLFLDEELKRIVMNIRTGYKPEKIILFGSSAGKRIKRGSDIDLLVIKKTLKNPWARIAEVDRHIDHNVPLDLLVYTPKEIEDRLKMNDFFIKDVMEKGKVLYER